MAALDDILAQIPVADIAGRVGIDEATATAAISQILPSLVGGMKSNADSGGAAGLAGALKKHGTAGHAAPADIDEEDGAKIVSHIFGDKKETVATQLADSTPNQLVSSGTIMKLLPILAPIVLSLIGKKIFGGGDDDAAATTKTTTKTKTSSKKKTTKVDPPAEDNGFGGLGDLLGGILGGGSGSGSASSSGGGFLGGILGKLGGLFGGGK